MVTNQKAKKKSNKYTDLLELIVCLLSVCESYCRLLLFFSNIVFRCLSRLIGFIVVKTQKTTVD